MAKQGDLWDDSALVTAFNEAITTYKKMNIKKASDVSNDIVSRDQSICDVSVENKEDTRQEDENEKKNIQLNAAKEAEEISNPSLVKENQTVESVEPLVSDSHVEASQGSQDYNQLLNQYHELEQQRQNVINQLHQYGAWNYQYNDGAYNSATTATQWTNGSTFPLVCPCVGQCCDAPCPSVPTCGPASGTKPDIVGTAMGAAERAISSLRTKIADDSNLNGANEGRENEVKDAIQSASSDTDLSDVLNAWYSAGFYTGKYLVEQSIAKKHQS